MTRHLCFGGVSGRHRSHPRFPAGAESRLPTDEQEGLGRIFSGWSGLASGLSLWSWTLVRSAQIFIITSYVQRLSTFPYLPRRMVGSGPRYRPRLGMVDDGAVESRTPGRLRQIEGSGGPHVGEQGFCVVDAKLSGRGIYGPFGGNRPYPIVALDRRNHRSPRGGGQNRWIFDTFFVRADDGCLFATADRGLAGSVGRGLFLRLWSAIGFTVGRE